MTLDRFFGDFSGSGRNFRPGFDPDLLPFFRFTNWSYPQDSMGPSPDLPVGRGWTADAFNLRVSMPGIGDKDFTVSTHGRGLAIRGERMRPTGFCDEGLVSFGLTYGRFEKWIELPEGLDLDKMTANFHHGVLDIRIPLLGHAKARAVPVSVGATSGFVGAAA